MKISRLSGLSAVIALLIVLMGCGVYEYSGDIGKLLQLMTRQTAPQWIDTMKTTKISFSQNHLVRL